MNWARWERFAPLAGIAAVALWLVGLLVMGDPPEEEEEAGPQGTANQVLRWYQDDSGAILLGGLLFQLGALFFLVFVVALRVRLVEAEGANGFLSLLASAGGIGAGLFMLALPGADMSGALNDEELTAESALSLRNVDDVFFLGAEMSGALLVTAAGLLAIRTRALPAWLGWLSLLLALLLLIQPIGWIAVILLMPLWILVTCVVLFRRPPAAAAAAP